MKTPGVPIAIQHKVVLESLTDEIKIVPFGDMHYGTALFCTSRWKAFKKYYKDKPRVLFLGMGDYTDAFSTTDRKTVESMRADEWVASHYFKEMDALRDELSFMKGRLLGLVDGNHRHVVKVDRGFGYAEVMEGTCWLAEQLETRYLGNPGVVLLNLTYKGGGYGKTIKIAAHHGTGGGVLLGSTFNSLEKWGRVFIADIYLMGHDHKLGWAPGTTHLDTVVNTKTNEVEVKERKTYFGRTGSFLKAYELGVQSYIADIGRAAAHIGTLEITLRMRRPRGFAGEGLVVDIGGGTAAYS